MPIPTHRASGAVFRVLLTGLLAAIPLAGCTDNEGRSSAPVAGESKASSSGGDDAVWTVASAAEVTSAADSFVAIVSRVGCSGGITGEVFAPSIELGQVDIVVTFTVNPLPQDRFYTCPGNLGESYEVKLGETIGNRRLVDGSCLNGTARSTGLCIDGPERWEPKSLPG